MMASCFSVLILGYTFPNLCYVRNICLLYTYDDADDLIFPSISYRFHLLFIDSLIICIFEFHNMRQYWKSVIMMLVYSVLLSVTNY